jgi:hypothetical protein
MHTCVPLECTHCIAIIPLTPSMLCISDLFSNVLYHCSLFYLICHFVLVPNVFFFSALLLLWHFFFFWIQRLPLIPMLPQILFHLSQVPIHGIFQWPKSMSHAYLCLDFHKDLLLPFFPLRPKLVDADSNTQTVRLSILLMLVLDKWNLKAISTQ